MDAQVKPSVREQIKNFLIVGETLDGIYSFTEYRLVNILSFFTLLTSSIVSFINALGTGTYWWILFVGFISGAIYFILISQIDVIYAITKFRIIKLENDLISRFFFRSSRLIGFTDLHYEHVESIQIGTVDVSAPRFYFSLTVVSVGWLILTQREQYKFPLEFTTLIAVLLIVAGVLNIIFSLPFGGVKLVVQSVSGEMMEFPEKKTPKEFVNDLILNCRTFLSYGAK